MLFVRNFRTFCCFDLPLEGVFVGRSFDPRVTPPPWPTQKWKHRPEMTRTKNTTSSTETPLPPRKNMGGSLKPVGFCFVCGSPKYLFVTSSISIQKKNTGSVHSGPFQRIHAPQQQRRVTWRWIFVSADVSGGCDFCLARRGVCNMDGFFLKSAQQKTKHLSTRNSRDCNRKNWFSCLESH